MNCPHCSQPIPDRDLSRHLSSKGGKAGRGKSKARTSAQARKAALARWERRWAKMKSKRLPDHPH